MRDVVGKLFVLLKGKYWDNVFFRKLVLLLNNIRIISDVYFYVFIFRIFVCNSNNCIVYKYV